MTTAIGNLEICIENVWQSVSTESLLQSAYSVVCRSLGFTDFNSIQPIVSHVVDNSESITFEQSIFCRGNEQNLSECSLLTAGKRSIMTPLDVVVRIACPGKPDLCHVMCGGCDVLPLIPQHVLKFYWTLLFPLEL